MARNIHHRTVGDTRTPLGVTLSVNGTAIDLTGTTVKFKLVAANGTVKLAETATGITITVGSGGEVQYDFSAASVDTAGIYFGWFVVYSGLERDTFPSDGRELQIEIHESA